MTSQGDSPQAGSQQPKLQARSTDEPPNQTTTPPISMHAMSPTCHYRRSEPQAPSARSRPTTTRDPSVRYHHCRRPKAHGVTYHCQRPKRITTRHSPKQARPTPPLLAFADVWIARDPRCGSGQRFAAWGVTHRSDPPQIHRAPLQTHGSDPPQNPFLMPKIYF
jgi:hypothetical protein